MRESSWRSTSALCSPGVGAGVRCGASSSIRCARLVPLPLDPDRLGDTEIPVQIRVGFAMTYDCPQPTPMVFNLNVHFTRASDLVGRDDLVFDPPVPMAAYRDSFGNWCTRIVAPQGRMSVSANAIVNDSGAPDAVA